jgi:hypothetical protein
MRCRFGRVLQLASNRKFFINFDPQFDQTCVWSIVSTRSPCFRWKKAHQCLNGSAFPMPEWTVIVDATSNNPERAPEALEKLCVAYRQPIMNWFKRRDFYQGHEDLTHSFVAYIVEKSLLYKVAPRTGKFRCFLTTRVRDRIFFSSGERECTSRSFHGSHRATNSTSKFVAGQLQSGRPNR